MTRVARSDNDARHARLIEHPSDRDRSDTGAVTQGNGFERGEQRLEAIPPAEFLDDQQYFTRDRFSSGGAGSVRRR